MHMRKVSKNSTNSNSNNNNNNDTISHTPPSPQCTQTKKTEFPTRQTKPSPTKVK
ncbi:hypothetical protein P167DRAFT_534654 [Morchella conica CCBAS932]|uniref:Uncharacterized protein n=1 Tax=Morchella conica CCBAS932 TaxID=1392247 RepID=A0A3N4KX38_9PEZI|nr:hypothetical protein P167DRAFT_534654 [Morchella conica CCBAS932]